MANSEKTKDIIQFNYEKVVVYQNKAEVKRKSGYKFETNGEKEIVITNLSSSIDPDSIRYQVEVSSRHDVKIEFFFQRIQIFENNKISTPYFEVKSANKTANQLENLKTKPETTKEVEQNKVKPENEEITLQKTLEQFSNFYFTQKNGKNYNFYRIDKEVKACDKSLHEFSKEMESGSEQCEKIKDKLVDMKLDSNEDNKEIEKKINEERLNQSKFNCL